MSFVLGLQCRECGQEYEKKPLHVCENCFGPLEIHYDYAGIKNSFSREKIAARERNLWRYRELLPIDGEPRVGLYSGFTPLVRAHRLGAALGVKEFYVKDDSVNHPTFSYKDRVVSVAISKAIEFGFDTVSCASTGNLANSVAAHAAKAGLDCYVFIPDGLEQGKIIGSAIYGPKTVAIKGNYDDVNRLCTEIGDKYGWAFVNVNLRPYYSEGAKTHGFEVAEQLGWKLPQHIVVASAGGTILPKLAKGFKELIKVGLVEDSGCKIYSAQAAGCAPIINALHKGTDLVTPGQAEHDRQLDRHRQSRRRLLCHSSRARVGRLGRERHRRRNSRRHQAARAHRRNLYRAGRRHRSRRDQKTDRKRDAFRATNRSSSASPAMAIRLWKPSHKASNSLIRSMPRCRILTSCFAGSTPQAKISLAG